MPSPGALNNLSVMKKWTFVPRERNRYHTDFRGCQWSTVGSFVDSTWGRDISKNFLYIVLNKEVDWLIHEQQFNLPLSGSLGAPKKLTVLSPRQWEIPITARGSC